MPRRVTVPDDLFRPTAVPPPLAEAPAPAEASVVELAAPAPAEKPARAASGRVKHDEKMTVYVTSDELLDLEQARLVLRRDHGLAVDRGRLVREAVALVLADLDENGLDSLLVQRLTER